MLFSASYLFCDKVVVPQSFQIVLFAESHIVPAARLFAQRFAVQRQAVPQLPGAFADEAMLAGKLRWLASTGNAVVAMAQGELVAYLGWILIDGFRGTSQRAAYCPEWAHACMPGAEAAAYQAMYTHAAARWTLDGCGTHAVTTLATDVAVREFLFWNGFGMAVVDAIRGLDGWSPASASGGGVHCRPATPDDLPAILALDGQLVQHLHAPPVLMPLHRPRDLARQAQFLARDGNSVWLAIDEGHVVGMLRFETHGKGACEIVRAGDAIAICGAFVLDTARRQGVAATLLENACRWYRDRGFGRCSVDWESFNPEATGFWPRHFTPVCFSLIRHIERSVMAAAPEA